MLKRILFAASLLLTAPAIFAQSSPPGMGNMTPNGGSATAAGQIRGTATNDNASAGNVGEYVVSNNTTAQSLASGTPLNVTSISLTPGDWDVTGSCQFGFAV